MLTDRWQTTIPAEVRRALKLRPRQRLVYELRDGGVFIRPETESLMDLYGVLGQSGSSDLGAKAGDASGGEVGSSSLDDERSLARAARVSRYMAPSDGSEPA